MQTMSASPGYKKIMSTVGMIILFGHTYFLFVLLRDYENTDDKESEGTDYVTLWVPIFLTAVIIEVIWRSRWAPLPERGPTRINDSICSIATGALMQITKKMVNVGIGIAPYAYVYRNFALTRQFEESSMLAWIFMFVAVDFCYYWVHRTGHTFRVFFAMHGVHHQSEDANYNLTMALRQSALHGLVSWAYYIPLAFFFPPLLYYYHAQFNLLYQFWIHTEMVPKLPSWVRWVFNTPALHAVHHGRNEHCIDVNYAGTLILFDRIFGTYQEPLEEVPVVFGLTHSINTMNPVRANTDVWCSIWQQMRDANTLYDKFLVLYNGPGWIVGTHNPQQEYPIPPCTRDTVQQYNPRYSKSLNAYFFTQFVIYLGFHSLAMTQSPESSQQAFDFWLFSVYLLLQPYTIGLLMDRASNAFTWELGRIGFGVLLGVHFFATTLPLALVAVIVFAFVSVVWLSQSLDELAVPIGEHEIGKDLDGAAEAEALIWQQYNDAKKTN